MAAWPLLVQAARCVGAAQIQNRGTIGGNIANASPAGDSLPVLLAYDAIVHVASVRGERAIPFRDLQTGYRQLALEADRADRRGRDPGRGGGAKQFFRKVGTRAAQSISKVVFAGVLVPGKGGQWSHVRLAWGTWRRSQRSLRAGSRAARAQALGAGGRVGERRAGRGPRPDRRHPFGRRVPVERRAARARQFLRSSHAGFRG